MSSEYSSATPTTSGPQEPSRRGVWKWFLRLALGLLILGIVIWRGDTQPLRIALQSTPTWVIVAATFAYGATQILSAWKWQLLLRARGARVSLLDCCRWYWAGMFWNLWMPTNIGGDGTRAYLAARHGAGLSTAVSSIFIERLTGLLALLVLAFTGVLLNTTQSSQNVWIPLLVTTAVTGVAGVLFLVLRAWSSRQKAGNRESPLLRKWRSLQESLEFYARAPQRPVLLAAILLSFIFQTTQIGINIGLAQVVGLELPTMMFLWLVPFLSIASMLPVGIGGLGVREAAAVSLLAGSGAISGTVIAWSLLWQTAIWLSSLPGVLVSAQPDKKDAVR